MMAIVKRQGENARNYLTVVDVRSQMCAQLDELGIILVFKLKCGVVIRGPGSPELWRVAEIRDPFCLFLESFVPD